MRNQTQLAPDHDYAYEPLFAVSTAHFKYNACTLVPRTLAIIIQRPLIRVMAVLGFLVLRPYS